jgi:hypothetical protein
MGRTTRLIRFVIEIALLMGRTTRLISFEIEIGKRYFPFSRLMVGMIGS